MNIDINDQITLSDGNIYLVGGKGNLINNNNEKVYFLLVDTNNFTNTKCCYENTENHSVVVVSDKKIIQKLLPKFIDSQNEAYIDSLVDSMDEESE